MQPKRKLEGVNQYLKFAGMGVQMVVIIVLFTYFGYWLDGKFELVTPYFTAGLSLLGVFAAIYLMIKQLPKSE